MLWQVKSGTKTHLIELPDQIGDDRPFPIKIGGQTYIGRWHCKKRTLNVTKATKEAIGEPLTHVLKTRSLQLDKAIDESETNVSLEYMGGDSRMISRFTAAVDVYSPALAGAGADKQVKAKSIRSPMSGKILAVNVQIGEQVEQGAVLLVVEAMKMENKIFAPRAGKVSAIKVDSGQAVNVGQELIVIG